MNAGSLPKELTPRAVAEALGEETLPQNVSAAFGDPDKHSVVAGQLRAPHCWERLLVEAAVIGGRERWQRRIAGLTQELRKRLAEIEDENEALAAIVRRNLEDMEVFADYALPLVDSLDALPKFASWGGWLDHLGALATRALRQPQRVLSVLSELSPMAAVGPVALSDVLHVISDLLLKSVLRRPPSVMARFSSDRWKPRGACRSTRSSYPNSPSGSSRARSPKIQSCWIVCGPS